MKKIIRNNDEILDRVSTFEHDTLVSIDPDDAQGFVDPAALLAEARERAEGLVQQAYEEGLSRGMEAGQAQFNESVGEASAMLLSAASAIQQAHREFLDSLEMQVVELSFLLARRILENEASVNPEVLRTTVRQALTRMLEQERVVLRINPDDAEVLERQRATLLEEFESIGKLEVLHDESVACGGCIAESDTLYVDTQLQTQLAQIFDSLREQVSEDHDTAS